VEALDASSHFYSRKASIRQFKKAQFSLAYAGW
jgi:hypothetical protein